ncbi:MAG TPA: type II secretion system F family protein [Candidatus Sulfotelmatobacter sp.]|jgi:type IV pilus assembly protein PilC|nr:type II secretion system F family protein [Candidatus Sulfotelmatobacter sp.]
MNLSTQITLFSSVGYLEKVLFTKHLAIMIKSGIPIGEAIDIIKQQTKNFTFQKILTQVSADITNGQSLEKALEKHPKAFDSFYINLIRIGEESGNLEKNLEYLAVQLKKNYEFKKKVRGALLYPEIVLLITFIAGGAISVFVLPKLIDLFSQLNVKLPLSTQILLFIATVMKQYGYFIIAGFIGLFIGLRAAIKTPKINLIWTRLLLSLPVLGVFLQDVELGYFSRNVGIMLKSGLTITTALFAQHRATTNVVFKAYIKKIAEDVEKGKTISDVLQKNNFPYVPSLLIKMIGVGEKTGNLDESLIYLGDFFEEEIDEYSKNLATILEPVILIFVGLAVAFVAFAIISPIYQLTNGIHQ